MGRANAPPPPIAENGSYSPSTTSSRSSTTAVGHNGNGNGHSGASTSGSTDVNKTLPRPSLEGERETHGTVRRVAAPLGRREPSYEEDEYDDEGHLPLEDSMHPSMLDSVIMPAITSVRPLFLSPLYVLMGLIWFRCSPVWRPPRRDWHLLTYKELLSRQSV